MGFPLLLDGYFQLSGGFFDLSGAAGCELSGGVEPAAEEAVLFFAALPRLHRNDEPSGSRWRSRVISRSVNSHQDVTILRGPIPALVVVLFVAVEDSALLIEEKLRVLLHSIAVDVHHVSPIGRGRGRFHRRQSHAYRCFLSLIFCSRGRGRIRGFHRHGRTYVHRRRGHRPRRQSLAGSQRADSRRGHHSRENPYSLHRVSPELCTLHL